MKITAKITDISRAIHTLEGIVKGISADDNINDQEIIYLQDWLNMHTNHRHIYPFSEAYELIERVLEDKEIDHAERDELLDFCKNFMALEGSMSILAMEMRNLHGWISGIICDNKVNEIELRQLREWMVHHSTNQDKWPFADIFKLAGNILQDGVITESEQQEFIDYCENFIEAMADAQSKDISLSSSPWMQTDAPILHSISSLVEKDPHIILENNLFCFTGTMKHGKRKDLRDALVNRGGCYADKLTMKTHYLVIGASSSPGWVFSTYGRKIDKIMNGEYPAKIISEDDFYKKLSSPT